MSYRKWLLAFSAFSVLSAPAFAETENFESALAKAYQTNPSLQAERAKLRTTDELVSQAESNWRPSIDANGQVGYQRQAFPSNSSSAATVTGNTAPRSVGVTVTQPIFRGFRTVAGVRAAEAQVQAQRAQLHDAEQQLLLDAATSYLDVVQDQTVLEIDRNNEDVLAKQLEATRDRFAVGDVTQTDVSQAESRLDAATATRIQAEGTLANRRATFARLVGDMPGKLAQPKLTLDKPNTLDEAVGLAESKNPLVVSAYFLKDAAKEDITSAQGSLLPEVSLVGNATRSMEQSTTLRDREDQYSVVAKATIPLYRSGADYSRTRAAQQTETQRVLELENARRKARENVITAWQALMTARAAIVADKAAVNATDLALQGVREESNVGTRTTLDVLNAEQELLNSKVELVKAQHDEAVAVLQVRAAIGDLTAEALKLDVTIYNPNKNYDEVRNKWVGFSDTEGQ